MLAYVAVPHKPSMGPRFNGVEDKKVAPNDVDAALPSMGPRFNGVEDSLDVRVCKSRTGPFNGATL